MTEESDEGNKANLIAQRSLDRQEAHEKFCEERIRHFETFEKEIKQGLALIHKKLDEIEKTRSEQRILDVKENVKVQTRQSIMWAGFTFVLVFGAKYFIG